MVLVTLLSACTGTVADSGPGCILDTGGGHPTWANFGDPFFLTYCDSCHAETSPNRFGAPDGLYFDTEAEVLTDAAAIRSAVIDNQTMPLGGGLPPEDLATLDNYLSCIGG